MARIIIEEYTPDWRRDFEVLKAELWPQVSDVAIGMEHVGSTSVEGLAAKPIIDVDIIIESSQTLDAVRRRLKWAGYEYMGERGILERYAFECRKPAFAHNLYVCIDGGLALRNHLHFRDHLRTHAADRISYEDLKRSLARQFPHDMYSYVKGKTEFVTDILREYAIDEEELDVIAAQT